MSCITYSTRSSLLQLASAHLGRIACQTFPAKTHSDYDLFDIFQPEGHCMIGPPRLPVLCLGGQKYIALRDPGQNKKYGKSRPPLIGNE
jgi:hypothetical protein